MQNKHLKSDIAIKGDSKCTFTLFVSQFCYENVIKMWSKTFKIQTFLLFVILTLHIQYCESFHIATKIRHKHICGKKLLEKVFSQCEDIVDASVSKEQVYEKYAFVASNSNAEYDPYFDEDNSICCRGTACYNDVIRQYCDFW